MRIVIIGLGSIGRRHLNILQEMRDIEIAALRTYSGVLKECEFHIAEFTNFQDAIEFKPDCVIVSNPTSNHVESALPFLKMGIKTLIEKPISSSLKEAMKLQPYENLIRVAYCLRFLPVYRKLEEIIRNENVVKIAFKRSFYLPFWHLYSDYRNEYSARKELGGGVIRTLSHEIDLAVHWFKNFVAIEGFTDKVSNLEIDVDDMAFFSLKSESGTRIIYDIDFFSPLNINIGEAFTHNGKYTWDINTISFEGYENKKKEIVFSSSESIECMYKNQLNSFLEFVKNGNSENTTFQEALATLNIIEKIDT